MIFRRKGSMDCMDLKKIGIVSKRDLLSLGMRSSHQIIPPY